MDYGGEPSRPPAAARDGLLARLGRLMAGRRTEAAVAERSERPQPLPSSAELGPEPGRIALSEASGLEGAQRHAMAEGIERQGQASMPVRSPAAAPSPRSDPETALERERQKIRETMAQGVADRARQRREGRDERSEAEKAASLEETFRRIDRVERFEKAQERARTQERDGGLER